MTQRVTFHLNGAERSADVAPGDLLIDVLRDQLGCFGVNSGCGVGVCGACTVLVDGEPISSCLALAVAFDGREILTIEGLAVDGTLHPLQQRFVEAGALQCGFCTPGFILSAHALLQRNAGPSVEAIQHWLDGNLCRCGTYREVVHAIQAAARDLAGMPAPAVENTATCNRKV